MYKLTGALPLGSYGPTLLAEGLYLRCEYKEALGILEEAFDYSKKTNELFYLSRLNRLKGEGLQGLGAEAAEVKQYFRQSIDVARKQEAPLLELRSALSLAKYWQANDQNKEAHLLLTEILERVTPIMDIDVIPEYTEAQGVLTELI